jgi:choline-sulfatase
MADTSSPNVLVFLSDQHRPDWLGTHPEIPVRTPNIDALAGRGVRFRNALCPTPLCGPSRACLASGRSYDRSPVRTNRADFPVDHPTLYGRLRDRGGYHVLGCGKFDLMKQSKDWGVEGRTRLGDWGFSDGVNKAGKRTGAAGVDWSGDGGFEYSFERAPVDPYTSYLSERGLLEDHVSDLLLRRRIGHMEATFPTPLPQDAYCDDWTARRGLELLADRPDEEPWFLVVNFDGPHSPMDVTGRMHRLYRGAGSVDFPQPVDPAGDTDPGRHNEIRRNYAAMITNIDRLIGEYLSKLTEWGELEETLVVYASDHGEMLGDHGRWTKAVPYQPSTGIPMVVSGPGVRARGGSDALVDLVDLHATVLDYAGVPIPEGIDSRSLRPFLEGRADSHREYLTSGLGDWRLVFDGQHKLVDGFDTGEARNGRLLFDLVADQHETENIVEGASGRAEAMADRLPTGE